MPASGSIAVIIAAYEADQTIGRAVASALGEPEVGQVIVVDDASQDATASRARDADDGSGRLTVVRSPANAGPSAARNRALTLVEVDYVAILDADDVVAPGRFRRLLAHTGWDLIADNILFVPDGTNPTASEVPTLGDGYRVLDAAALIEGCLQRGSRTRSQLGFLKPVIRHDCLTGRANYDERVRLGEDFLLYLQLLADGARFVLVDAVGYVAVERGASLSGRHATADLAALLAGEEAVVATLPPGSRAAALMGRRIAETRAKHALRSLLDARRGGGLPGVFRWLVDHPGNRTSALRGVIRDKFDAARRMIFPPGPARPRLLFTPKVTER